MIPPSNFDFHCHSNVSDGLLAPAQVVERAAGLGVSHLALTDHDDIDGLFEAGQAAADLGICLVNGVEISAEWDGMSVHIVGLGFDAVESGLVAGLNEVRSGRLERARRMGDAFAAMGIPGVFEGALRHAGNPLLISRAHFARYLVETGLFKEPRNVFDHYLVPGKPGYVEHRWASLADAIQWIRGAGGVAVVAHPGRYRMSGGRMRAFLEAFKDLGGEGIEVVSGSHGPDHVLHFARLARHFALYASRGSDFHGPKESYVDLGCMGSLPEDLKPVWRLINF